MTRSAAKTLIPSYRKSNRADKKAVSREERVEEEKYMKSTMLNWEKREESKDSRFFREMLQLRIGSERVACKHAAEEPITISE